MYKLDAQKYDDFFSKQGDMFERVKIKPVFFGYNEYIEPKFSFDNFVKGTCNTFCIAACRDFVSRSEGMYNPLYIHGGVGTGKTHLAQAVTNALLAEGYQKIIFRTGGSFISEVIEALRNGVLEALKKRYYDADAFILDDLNFVAGNRCAMNLLLETFNWLHCLNKPIMLTSCTTPTVIYDLDDCLRSRFSSGLLAYLNTPTLETKLSFISRNSKLSGIILDDDTSMLLASRVRYDFRGLACALNTLQMYASHTGQIIDSDLTEDILKGLLKDEDNT